LNGYDREESPAVARPLRRERFIRGRDLLLGLVDRELKLRYKRSVMGLGWSLLNPLARLLVFVVVFEHLLPLGIPNYPAFVFSGLLAWSWFELGVVMSAGAVVDRRELVRTPGFPIAILPVVTVTTHLVHFLLALPILAIFLLVTGHPPTPALAALPR
jgi:lipopolysaccharide transport system permease protein